MRQEINRNSGFTMLEVIIALVVIVVLSVAILAVINPARRIGDTNDSRRKNDLNSLIRAVELYTADYGSAPSQFASSTIGAGNKHVICAQQANLSCDGETRTCLLITDAPFIGTYLATLPVDPTKTAASDTGYYITRRQNNVMAIGACDSYDTGGVEISGRVNLPTYVAPSEPPAQTCGNGIVEGTEVCDYTGTTCSANSSYRSAGFVYDGSTCTSSHYACNTGCTACITQLACTGSCGSGGILSDGYCHYLGALGETCTTVCASHAGCVSGGWTDTACSMMEQAGANCSNCETIGSGKSHPSWHTTGATCYEVSSTGYACSTSPLSNHRRLCRCNS